MHWVTRLIESQIMSIHAISVIPKSLVIVIIILLLAFLNHHLFVTRVISIHRQISYQIKHGRLELQNKVNV
jgi:hypothetical protein